MISVSAPSATAWATTIGKLAHLVAAKPERNRVVALDENACTTAERIAQPVRFFDGRGKLAQGERREFVRAAERGRRIEGGVHSAVNDAADAYCRQVTMAARRVRGRYYGQPWHRAHVEGDGWRVPEQSCPDDGGRGRGSMSSPRSSRRSPKLIAEIQARFDPKLARMMAPHITIIGSSGAGPIAPATPSDESAFRTRADRAHDATAHAGARASRSVHADRDHRAADCVHTARFAIYTSASRRAA